MLSDLRSLVDQVMLQCLMLFAIPNVLLPLLEPLLVFGNLSFAFAHYMRYVLR